MAARVFAAPLEYIAYFSTQLATQHRNSEKDSPSQPQRLLKVNQLKMPFWSGSKRTTRLILATLAAYAKRP